jgi:hypothetical protein
MADTSSAATGSRRVLVFGASGGVGRHVVEQALARGHEVRAVVRSPGKLSLSDPKLTIVAAELSERQAIDAAVRGAESVISALGPSLDRRATGMPLVQGTQNIVDAMEAADVQALRRHRHPSLRDPRDRRGLLGMLVPLIGRLLLPRAYRELLAMSQIVVNSDSSGRSRASPVRPTARRRATCAPASSVATRSARRSRGPTSPPSCSTSSKTPASSAPRPPSATDPTEKGPEQ